MSAAATTMVAYTHIKPDSKRRRSCLYRPPQIHMPSNNSSMLATTPKTTMNMASSLWLWLLPAHDKYQINILLMGGSFSVFFLFSSHASFVRRHYAKGSSKLFFTISFKFCIFIFFFSPLSLLSSPSKLVSTTAVGPLYWLVSNKIFGQIIWDSLYKKKMTRDDWWSFLSVPMCGCLFATECVRTVSRLLSEARARLNCVELRVAYPICRCIIVY